MTSQSSTKNPLETLQSFGLEERTARLYLALLELGEASILQLSKKSGVERTVIYYLLKDLRRLQLVKEVYDENNRVKLQPVSPKRLLQIEDDRHSQLKTSLPELEALFQETPDQPRIRIFKGIEGIDELYDDLIDTLRHQPKGQREMLTYTSMDMVVALPIRNQEAFRAKRVEYQIPIRVIGNNTAVAHEFIKIDAEQLRQTRLLPVGTPEFTATFVVYANKVAQYNMKGDIHVLLIENADLAATQRTMFELAWHALTPED